MPNKKSKLEYEEVKGLINQAIQAGKNETSGITKQFMKMLKDMQDRNEKEHKKLKESIERLEPLVRWFDNMDYMKKTFMFVLKVMATVGGLILLSRQLLNQ